MHQWTFEEPDNSMAISEGWTSSASDFTINALVAESERYAPIKLTKVHDYKDRFILRSLQEEARRESPGFLWYQERAQRAKVAWVKGEGGLEPVGYYICDLQRPAHVPGIPKDIWYPDSLAQIYVSRKHRRKGYGQNMVEDFLRERSDGPVWVESPRYETRSILNKLGLKETDGRYEIWQMMAGLTRWNRY
jgi:GNAT superfamily N-acetyltransferase